LRLYRAVGKRGGEADTLANIASIEGGIGRLNESRAHFEACLQIIESLRTKVVSRELRASYFATVQEKYESYIELLMRLHEQQPTQGNEAVALQAVERARARSLLESLAEARADIRQGVDPALLARERSVQQRLNQKAEEQLKLFSGSGTEAQITAIKKAIDTLTTELQQVQTQIRQSSPRYAALTQPQLLTLAEIQQQVLDADTILLEYSLGKERSYLWAVTPASMKSYELPKRAEIEEAALRVNELLSGVKRAGRGAPEQRGVKPLSEQAVAAYVQAATKLSEMVLGPVADQLGKKRVVIVADGALLHISGHREHRFRRIVNTCFGGS
jgi:hypothetical protein